MASKVTPLYAETRILLDLTGLGGQLISPSNFVPKGTHYQQALTRLIEQDYITETLKGKRYKKYSITAQGKQKLAENLTDEKFSFFAVAGPKTTNSLLRFLREENATTATSQNGHAVTVPGS
ncbi:MAG: hypothetical protein AAFR99_22455 [Cyanobacteria bacterium J06629_9]